MFSLLPARVRASLFSKTMRVFLPPIAGFFAYGAWAFMINIGHGNGPALTAALTQAVYSFSITLSLALVVEYLYKVLARLSHHWLWVIAITWIFVYLSSWTVNTLMETPNVLLTLLPGAMIGTVYTVIYVLILKRASTKVVP